MIRYKARTDVYDVLVAQVKVMTYGSAKAAAAVDAAKAAHRAARAESTGAAPRAGGGAGASASGTGGEFEALLAEIEERQQFLVKMRSLKCLDHASEAKVKSEIAERISRMKGLDKAASAAST